MSVKEFVGGTNPIVSDQAWFGGDGFAFPQVGDQLVVHNPSAVAWVWGTSVDAFINFGSPFNTAPSTVSLGNSAVDLFDDRLVGPIGNPDPTEQVSYGNVSVWGSYGVVNLADYTPNGGNINTVTTATGATAYYNQQTVANNRDYVYINGGGSLSNYGTSNLVGSTDVVSIPDIGTGVWALDRSSITFLNSYVAPTQTIDLTQSTLVVAGSVQSAPNMQSLFKGQITSSDFSAGFLDFTGSPFTKAVYTPGKGLDLTADNGFTQSFNMNLKTTDGAYAAVNVWKVSDGVMVTPGSNTTVDGTLLAHFAPGS